MSSLVGSVYNIADQIFVGQKLGTVGNAATNVAFPLVLLMVTFSMTIGSGGASKFSLHQGARENEEAGKTIGNSLIALAFSGVFLMLVTLIFLRPMMLLFGAKGETLELAVAYTQITAIGIPFYILGTGCSMYVRADGSPQYAMLSTVTGAVLNIIFDPILIFVFNMGIRGAAIATIAGQIVSAIISVAYLHRFKSVKLKKEYFTPNVKTLLNIVILGLPIGLMQIAVMLVQITMNNILGYYGELSVYGRDIPLAVAGIVSKVSTVFNSVIMGICQSCQPIFGYNWGVGNYKRVKEAFKQAAIIVTGVSTFAFLLFQIFPHQILEIFQQGNELYLEFGTSYLRIFMFAIFLYGIQILTSIFFPAVGNAKKGIIASLSRQVLFQLPLILILPLFLGLNGVLFAGPIADVSACVLAIFLIWKEFKKIQ
jgi:Na+-driven multidrug efflux pump